MDRIKTILPKAILAGMFINIAATIYLSIPNNIVAALLFTFGLLAVLVTQSNLYTGKVGYFPNIPLYDLVITLIGNICGCIIYSILYSTSSHYININSAANTVCDTKFSATPLSIFVTSIFCGALMFIAVDGFKKNKNVIGVAIVTLCVAGFILAGFEHSIANISFVALAQYNLNLSIIFKLLLMVIGNFIGSVITRLMIYHKINKESES